MKFRPTALWPLLFVFLAIRAFWWLSELRWRLLDPWWSEGALKILVWVVPSIVLLVIIRGGDLRAGWRDLGLNGSAGRGYLLGLAATMPMLVVLATSTVVTVPASALVGSAILGPLAEEVLFRGFLLLCLLRWAWRAWPAMIVSAAAFGLAHTTDIVTPLLVYLPFALEIGRPDAAGQIVADVFQQLAYAAMLGVGGLVFAWLVIRWGSLWPAIGLHSAINFWWLLLQGVDGSPAVGFGLAPAAHAASVLLAVVVTLWLHPERATQRTSPAIGRSAGLVE